MTPAFIMCVGVTMLLLGATANLLVWSHAQGVVQLAAEEAARQGVAVGHVAACRARAAQVVDAGLGSLAHGVQPARCALSPQGIQVEVAATLPPWLPALPPLRTVGSASVHGPTAP